MSVENLAGWTVTALLILGGVLRALTVFLNDATFGKVGPVSNLRDRSRIILVAFATVVGAVAVVGSWVFEYPGLWGPGALVFSVIWSVNSRWKVRYLPWVAPVQDGLEIGDSIVLLAGALGTLIAYVFSLG